MIDIYIKFIKAHETILALVLAAVVIFGVSGKIESIIAAHDRSNLTAVEITSQAQAQKNAATAAQVAEDKRAFDALQAKSQAQYAALIKANAALATALTKQQKSDGTLPPTALVARLNTLVPLADATVVTNGVLLPEQGAVSVVEQLEIVPVLQTELVNEQILVVNGNALAVVQTKQVADLTSEVSGLKLKAVDDAKTCQEQIKVVKDDAHKREKWIGIIGAVLGYAIRGKV